MAEVESRSCVRKLRKSEPDASGESSGCTSVDNKALLKEIVQSPELFYVNVHNSVYPSGAVRGQLGQ